MNEIVLNHDSGDGPFNCQHIAKGAVPRAVIPVYLDGKVTRVQVCGRCVLGAAESPTLIDAVIGL